MSQNSCILVATPHAIPSLGNQTCKNGGSLSYKVYHASRTGLCFCSSPQVCSSSGRSLQAHSRDVPSSSAHMLGRDFPSILTQMSHLPGKNLSGMRAAYSAAPVIYRQAMSASQPICPIVAAFRSPSEMTKCRVGMTPLRPKARNTPRRQWKWDRFSLGCKKRQWQTQVHRSLSPAKGWAGRALCEGLTDWSD